MSTSPSPPERSMASSASTGRGSRPCSGSWPVSSSPARAGSGCSRMNRAAGTPRFLSRLFVLPEDIQVPRLTDREFISLRAPFYPGFDHERMGRYVDELGIPGGRRLTTLSLGQRKKFLLSFGLASGASLVVLDEPTNGLDIPSKGLFRRLIAEAMTDDRTFVVATHQVRDVEALIDRLVVLHAGRVLFDQSLTAASARVRTSLEGSRPEEGKGTGSCTSNPR